MRRARVELFEGVDGRWYFHKRNANGRITLASQGYTLRRTARRAAQRDIHGLPIVCISD